VRVTRKLAALATAGALCLPIAACGDDDVDKIRDDVKGNIDDLSKQDLKNALDDAEKAADSGSAKAKKKARELQRKIERELNSRD
jgi:hypothetical protein